MVQIRKEISMGVWGINFISDAQWVETCSKIRWGITTCKFMFLSVYDPNLLDA